MAEKYKTLPALKNKKWAVTLLPIEKIHLNPQKQYEREVKGNKSSLNTLIIIALVILLTAWINYINLATARAMERARDVGLRKVVGALRTQLASQFILESWLVNMAAFVLAFILVVLFKEAFNRIIGENIGLYLLKQPVLWISAILVLVSGIFLSGYYPAFIMSKVKPSVILKGNYFNFGSAGMTRRILVIFQFAAALFLMCGTFIIYRQIKFMEEQDLGVNVNQTLVVKFPVSRAGLENQVNLFAENLRQENTVRSVTLAGAVPGMEVAFFASNQLQGNSSDQGRLYEMLAVDDHFVETFRLKLLAGRSFQKGFGNDRESLLVNEASLATLGISNPEAAIGQRVMLEGELLPVTIIGVVQNWHQRGLGNSYTPVMFVPNGHLRWVKPRFIAIKTAGDKSEEVLRMVKDRWQSYFPEASFDYFFLDGFFDSQYKTDRRFSRIVAIFTVIAFFISALGLWALASFTASKKVKEVGVRKVLGAQTGSIIVLFSKEIIMLIMVSLVVSTPISYLVMKNWLQHYAFRTEISLWIYFLAGVISIYIALLTIGWQSWKAATRNPVEALRYE